MPSISIRRSNPPIKGRLQHAKARPVADQRMIYVEAALVAPAKAAQEPPVVFSDTEKAASIERALSQIEKRLDATATVDGVVRLCQALQKQFINRAR